MITSGKMCASALIRQPGKFSTIQQAKAIVQRFIPMVGMLTDDMIEYISSFNIRELAKMYDRLLMLSNNKLDKIDQALSKIPLEPDDSISKRGPGRGSDHPGIGCRFFCRK